MGLAILLILGFGVGVPTLTFLVGWSIPKPQSSEGQQRLSIGTIVTIGALILLGVVAAVANLLTQLKC